MDVVVYALDRRCDKELQDVISSTVAAHIEEFTTQYQDLESLAGKEDFLVDVLKKMWCADSEA